MRSRPEMRLLVEWAMRAIGLGALLILLLASLRTTPAGPGRDVDTDRISDRLSSISRDPHPPARIHARLSSFPDRATLDWLRALHHTGTRVTWSGDLSPLALSVRPVASPSRGWHLDVASSRKVALEMQDSASTLDSVRVNGVISRSVVPVLSGPLRATAAGSTMSASPRDSVLLKRVLVIGAPGWESRFITAALEEAGWPVDVEISLAPGVRIQQRRVLPMDTSHYSAVVAVDARAVPRVREIGLFAQRGGGVILTAEAARQPAFSALRAGRAAPGVALSRSDQDQSVSLASLHYSLIGALKSDAVVIEARGRVPTVAARRHVAGRVAQIAYEDTWKWRAAGDSTAPRMHRLWWTGLVSKVAYAPRVRLATSQSTSLLDDAPMASLYQSLGPPSPVLRNTDSGLLAQRDLHWLFAIACIAFLIEWTSRRLRGVP